MINKEFTVMFLFLIINQCSIMVFNLNCKKLTELLCCGGYYWKYSGIPNQQLFLRTRFHWRKLDSSHKIGFQNFLSLFSRSIAGSGNRFFFRKKLPPPNSLILFQDFAVVEIIKKFWWCPGKYTHIISHFLFWRVEFLVIWTPTLYMEQSTSRKINHCFTANETYCKFIANKKDTKM